MAREVIEESLTAAAEFEKYYYRRNFRHAFIFRCPNIRAQSSKYWPIKAAGQGSKYWTGLTAVIMTAPIMTAVIMTAPILTAPNMTAPIMTAAMICSCL